MTTPPTGFLRFKKSIFKDIWEINFFLIFWMFLHHPSKFGEFSLKIGGEMICQSWPLLTPFFNFRIVHCGLLFAILMMQAQIKSEGILSVLGKGKGILLSSKRMKKVQTNVGIWQGEGGLSSDEARWGGKSPPTGLVRVRVI